MELQYHLGDTLSFARAFTRQAADGSSAPIDLTGCAVAVTIRTTAKVYATASTAAHVNATAGATKVIVDPAALLAGYYLYRIILTDGSGTVSTLETGTIEVLND
jgi:hypothetical protein